MRDRYSGKSRGFGFVTFVYAADAASVVLGDHHVDGRRCEAKFALPRGGAPQALKPFWGEVPGFNATTPWTAAAARPSLRCPAAVRLKPEIMV